MKTQLRLQDELLHVILRRELPHNNRLLGGSSFLMEFLLHDVPRVIVSGRLDYRLDLTSQEDFLSLKVLL